MVMAVASTDVTYCTNKKCSKKCWRYYENYRYDKEGHYSYMGICKFEEERKRKK